MGLSTLHPETTAGGYAGPLQEPHQKRPNFVDPDVFAHGAEPLRSLVGKDAPNGRNRSSI